MTDGTAEAQIGLVLDCADPELLAPFWEQTLGYTRLGSAGNYVLLVSPSGRSPKLLLQRVDEPKAVKNRMHLDLEVTDVEAEVRRLEALGGHCVDAGPHDEHHCHWVVMADPEGNEFCLCHGIGTI